MLLEERNGRRGWARFRVNALKIGEAFGDFDNGGESGPSGTSGKPPPSAPSGFGTAQLHILNRPRFSATAERSKSGWGERACVCVEVGEMLMGIRGYLDWFIRKLVQSLSQWLLRDNVTTTLSLPNPSPASISLPVLQRFNVSAAKRTMTHA